MFGLIFLPYEVLSNIVANLNFEDVFNLGRTCKELSFLLTEESISKLVVRVSNLRCWHIIFVISPANKNQEENFIFE